MIRSQVLVESKNYMFFESTELLHEIFFLKDVQSIRYRLNE